MSKFYKYLVIIVVILALCGVLGTIVFYKKYKNTKEDYYIAKNNEKAYSVEIIFKVRRNGSLSNTLAPVLQNARERFHISSEEIKKYDTSDEIYYSVLRPNVSISLYGHLDGNYVVVKIVITDDELKEKQ